MVFHAGLMAGVGSFISMPIRGFGGGAGGFCFAEARGEGQPPFVKGTGGKKKNATNIKLEWSRFSKARLLGIIFLRSLGAAKYSSSLFSGLLKGGFGAAPPPHSFVCAGGLCPRRRRNIPPRHGFSVPAEKPFPRGPKKYFSQSLFDGGWPALASVEGAASPHRSFALCGCSFFRWGRRLAGKKRGGASQKKLWQGKSSLLGFDFPGLLFPLWLGGHLSFAKNFFQRREVADGVFFRSRMGISDLGGARGHRGARLPRGRMAKRFPPHLFGNGAAEQQISRTRLHPSKTQFLPL